MYFDIRAFALLLGAVSFVFLFFMRKKPNSSFKENLKILAFIPLLLGLITQFLYSPIFVPTRSMMPAIQAKDVGAVDSYSYGLRLPLTNARIIGTGIPKNGEIIAFYAPSKISYIKRVIGVSGDHVIIDPHAVTINGVEYTGSAIESNDGKECYRIDIEGNGFDYCFNSSIGDSDRQRITFHVPENKYFVIGDNRDESLDSRVFGFIDESALKGKFISF